MRCEEELPLVQGIMDRFKEEKLAVIVLGFQDTRGNLKESAEAKSLDKIIFAYDTEEEVSKKYGIRLVAASVFIGRDGIVTKRFAGGFNKTELLKETYRILD